MFTCLNFLAHVYFTDRDVDFIHTIQNWIMNVKCFRTIWGLDWVTFPVGGFHTGEMLIFLGRCCRGGARSAHRKTSANDRTYDFGYLFFIFSIMNIYNIHYSEKVKVNSVGYAAHETHQSFMWFKLLLYT